MQALAAARRDGTLTIRDWMRSLRGVRSMALFDRRDPKPFLAYPVAQLQALDRPSRHSRVFRPNRRIELAIIADECPMRDRAEHLIRYLDLEPHPEGGFFRQLFRSSSTVTPSDARGARAALTTIYFLLPDGDVSRWHRVESDEVWHFYEGAPLELWTLAPDLHDLAIQHLGPVSDAAIPVRTVPAGWWQAAKSTGAYSLVGCTVGPGFEFADFALAADLPAQASALRARHPTAAALL